MPFAALAYPAIDPIALRLGPFAVRWYGLAYLAGFVVAALVMRWLARRWELGLTDDDLLTIVLAAVIGVIAGGRLGYVLFYSGGYYFSHPIEILATWDGGMSFHGGLIGIMVASVVAGRLVGVPWLTLCDMGAVGTPVGLGFGRIANFINDELWGRTTSVAWGMVFPSGGPLPRHPSQLYEALLEGAVLFAVMLLLARRLPPRPRGELIGWMLALYAVFRIGVELFREPDAQLGFIAAGVTMGQLLSVPMLVLGVTLIWWSRKRALPPGRVHAEGAATGKS